MGDGRLQGDMGVGGREGEREEGKWVFSCIPSINTEGSKLLEVTHRLCVWGEAPGSQRMGTWLPRVFFVC